MEDELYVSGFDGLGDALLKIVRVVGVDVAREIQNEAPFGVIDFLESDLEAVVLFVVEPRYDLVVTHGAPCLQCFPWI